MLDLQTYATVLLIGRIISMVLLGLVIKRQYALSKVPIDEDLRHFRRILFALTVGIFLGNLIPLAIDILSIIYTLGRPFQVNIIVVLYTLSVSTVSMMSSYLSWRLYGLAENQKKMTDYTEETLKEQLRRK